MATKTGAGGEQQPYDESTGRYGYDSRNSSTIDRAAKKAKADLTKREFAVFYQKLGEIKLGGYVYKTKRSEMYIPIEEKDDKGEMRHKIAISTGGYINPKIKRVFEFENETAMQDFLLELDI